MNKPTFEDIVNQVIGGKQAFHTFGYDDVMAVVTAARAEIRKLEARGTDSGVKSSPDDEPRTGTPVAGVPASDGGLWRDGKHIPAAETLGMKTVEGSDADQPTGNS